MRSVTIQMFLAIAFGQASLAQSELTYMDIHPRWSPDGAEILYYRVPSDFSESWINIYDLKSGESRTVFGGGFFNSNPVWHPSGAEIAFASARPDLTGDWQLYRLNLATGTESKLTKGGGRKGHPTWSADGRSIAFQQRVATPDNSFKTDLYVLNADTAEETRLTTSEDNEFHPKFGPDGNLIVFDAGNRTEGHIYQYDLAAKSLSLLIEAPKGMRVGVPALSPDGTRVAYYLSHLDGAEGGTNLAVKNLETAEVKVLTNVQIGFAAGGASWSPDGSMMAFHISNESEATLWVIGSDGKGLRQLE